MTRRIAAPLAGLALIGATISGCAVLVGSAIGAGSGAAVAAGTGHSPAKGALIGASVGAAGGAIYTIAR